MWYALEIHLDLSIAQSMLHLASTLDVDEM